MTGELEPGGGPPSEHVRELYLDGPEPLRMNEKDRGQASGVDGVGETVR